MIDGPAWPSEDEGWAKVAHRDRAPDEAAYRAAYQRLRARWASLASRTPSALGGWRADLVAMGARWPAVSGKEAPRPATAVADDVALARLALDRAPAAGDDAPRYVLGPWAAQLDLSVPAHRAVWAAAVACATFAIAPDDNRSPFRSWQRELSRRRRYHAADTSAVVAVARTPLVPWRTQAVDGGWRLTPALPVRADRVPEVAVDLSVVGGVDGPPRDGGLLVARLVRCDAGWAVRTAFVLPDAPDDATLEAWWAVVAVPAIVATPELDADDLMRRHGHHLVARLHAWAWRRALTVSAAGPSASAAS